MGFYSIKLVEIQREIMRINSVTSPYITAITNNHTSKSLVLKNQNPQNDTFETIQNPMFKGGPYKNMGMFGRCKIAKYFKGNIPYEVGNIRVFCSELDSYFYPNTNKSVTKLFKQAKKAIIKNPTSSGAMYAIMTLLSKADKKELDSIDTDILNTAFFQYIKAAKDEDNYKGILENVDLILRAKPNLKFDDIKIDGEPILFKAVERENIDAIRTFAKRDDVNWNILNSKENNIALEAFATNDWLFLRNFTEFLLELPEDKFNINYMNSQGETVFSKVCSDLLHNQSEYVVENLLRFPNLDVNQKSKDGRPLYFKLIVNSYPDRDGENFKNCLLHPNFDDKTLMIPEINTQINAFVGKYRNPEGWKKILLDVVDKKSMQKMRDLYDENGIFSLEQMEDIVKDPNFDGVANMRINSIGERFVHLLADIPMQGEGSQIVERLRKILDKMKEANCYFRVQDDFGRNALEKARECENNVLVKLLQEYFHS